MIVNLLWEMKKKIYLFFLILMLNLATIVAQTEAERNKIIETYNLEQINILKKDLNEAFLQKEKRIATFLNKNSLYSKNFKSGGKKTSAVRYKDCSFHIERENASPAQLPAVVDK